MSTKLVQEDRPVVVPAEGPAPPPEERPVRRRGPTLRALRTFVVVAALLAGAGYGGTTIVHQRLAAATYVDVGNAVLTAAAIPVGSAEAGVVDEIMVSEHTQVAAGQELVALTLTANGTAKQPPVQILRAPRAGTVSAINVAVGSVARAGEPVLILYDQTKLTFEADVPVKDLRGLRVGMGASLTGPGIDRPVAATLDHVVPRVGNDPLAASDRLTVVFVPKSEDVARVSKLVPGLQFTATVDTKTAAGGTPAVNSAG
jgi:multidrug resistance efflux pump